MRLDKHGQGVWFMYHGDELLWIWPWKRHTGPDGRNYALKSGILDSCYYSLADYWYAMGAHEEALRKGKLEGFSLGLVVAQWARMKFGKTIVVVLENMNPEEKPSTFWKLIPPSQIKELQKDVVVLFFNSPHKALEVAESIPVEFASVSVYVHGALKLRKKLVSAE